MDESQNGTSRIKVEISGTSNGNSYDITVSNIINPSEVGQTGDFHFRTLTMNNEQILWGISSATI